MYIDASVLEKAFVQLRALDSGKTGKSRLEKASALRLLLATIFLFKELSTESLDLSVKSKENRKKFIAAVGRIVCIEPTTNEYTKDFFEIVGRDNDFAVGSNFLTTRLASSRSQEILYPGRPSPLLRLNKETVTLHEQYIQNLENDYGLSSIKTGLCLWLLRDYSFPTDNSNISAGDFVSLINTALNEKFTKNFASKIIPDVATLSALLKSSIINLIPSKADLTFIKTLNQGKEDVTDKNPDNTDVAHVLANDLDNNDEILIIVNKLLERGSKGILFSGPPGTSKTWYALKIALKLADGNMDRIARVQFHPSYSYEDFIEGLVATGSLGGEEPLFKAQHKTFINLCKTAIKDKDNNYYLIIDEFTRGDPSRIFGELLTYIESDYREVKFILPYSEDEFSVPNNVIILATMNPYDKSVVDLDSAMERRFEMIELPANKNILRAFLDKNEVAGDVIGKCILFFDKLNEYSEHGFGHAFFKDLKDEDDFILLWNHKLKFILTKMFRFKEDAYKDLRNLYREILPEPQRDLLH